MLAAGETKQTAASHGTRRRNRASRGVSAVRMGVLRKPRAARATISFAGQGQVATSLAAGPYVPYPKSLMGLPGDTDCAAAMIPSASMPW